MAWNIEYGQSAARELAKLDRPAAAKILDYMDHRVALAKNPRSLGAALTGKLKGCWRYRVGDYRLICEIQDHRLVVLVLKVGHRREIYLRA